MSGYDGYSFRMSFASFKLSPYYAVDRAVQTLGLKIEKDAP